MALVTCKLCRKIYNNALFAKKVCPDCARRLDDLYSDVRNYLRDNPRAKFNVEVLSEKLGADVRDLESLVELGYLNRDKIAIDSSSLNQDDERQKLAKEFEGSIEKMKATVAAMQSQQHKTVSYGQSVYGDKGSRR